MVLVATALRRAVFDRFNTSMSWTTLASRHAVGVGVIRRAYSSWCRKLPESQSQSAADIHLDNIRKGRHTTFTAAEESTLADTIVYLSQMNTPLSRQGVRDLVQEFVSLLPECRKSEIGFQNNRPSNGWVTAFMHRNNLSVHHLQTIEDKKVNAVTPENLSKHIDRVQAAIKRFNITSPSQIFNTDQSGASFAKMKRRSLRKGVGLQDARLVQKCVSTNGNIEHVTIMSVVSACGKAYKPAVVFPGKLAHYRKVKGQIQSLHSVLPECYLSQRNPAGVDSNIVFEWAKCFVEETKTLRDHGQNLLLLLDGYGAHMQYSTLKYLKDHRIIVIALPAHTSHVTQPLDVSVFNSYRSFLQHELHRAARHKSKLNVFDIAQCIHSAYSRSHTVLNIQSGFLKTGVWDPELLAPNFAPLEKYITERNGSSQSGVTMKDLVAKFGRQERTLLQDGVFEEEGHICVDTSHGGHLTSNSVLEALEQRRIEKQKREEQQRKAEDKAAYKEPKADVLRLIHLAPARAIRRAELNSTRKARRNARRLFAAAARAAASCVNNSNCSDDDVTRESDD